MKQQERFVRLVRWKKFHRSSRFERKRYAVTTTTGGRRPVTYPECHATSLFVDDRWAYGDRCHFEHDF